MSTGEDVVRSLYKKLVLSLLVLIKKYGDKARGDLGTLDAFKICVKRNLKSAVS